MISPKGLENIPVIADRLDHGESIPELNELFAISA
jgi:hypothetical protein